MRISLLHHIFVLQWINSYPDLTDFESFFQIANGLVDFAPPTDLHASVAVLEGIAQSLSLKQTAYLNGTGLHPSYTFAAYLKTDPMINDLFDLGNHHVNGFRERWANVVETPAYGGSSKPVLHMTGM
jgi:hypothetical protein